ncbi:NAD(P)/FAD-dependent oxidoreductase [Mycolicibacterium komossense]|uniref:FAD-dependent oxidoreductase n=1 Tax=Mycolicibacterium komossense TaxID=1779 RepID=A0ABT3C8K6_9MYCO|nr:FAD-binding oxidoreductase [Mycolicibacterium komossense]MCV7225780.1 FAD-dependent oxidoreductase [Mycolicibacterium komossense]
MRVPLVGHRCQTRRVSTPINGHVSHWFTEIPEPRDPLPGDRDADVCIVGAGYTGLWTAFYLKRADPSLRITVLEARFAGFGASGRNGGWLSGLAPGHRTLLAKKHGRPAVVRWQRALNGAVDEVIDVAAREGIEAGIVKGGSLRIARNEPQAQRLRAEVDESHEWGVPEVRLLPNSEVNQRIRIDDLHLAAFSPHCGRIQPAQLVRGLADVVERLGVTIYEQTPVTQISAGRAVTARGTVRAPTVLRATEGFTTTLPGLKRRWLPMNSAMIATEPLPADVWESIGWEGRETLGDTAHGFFYAQRTADDRIAIGGRAVPYRYASGIDRDGAVGQYTITSLREVLNTLLPQTRGIGIAHGWCGVLAVPRDWSAGVELDRATGLGWAGGYVGHGVTATNLAGQTLADLVLRRDTALVRMPWVGHRSKTWEPEPLRWLGVRGMYQAYRAADRHESGARAKTSPIAVVADAIARRP